MPKRRETRPRRLGRCNRCVGSRGCRWRSPQQPEGDDRRGDAHDDAERSPETASNETVRDLRGIRNGIRIRGIGARIVRAANYPSGTPGLGHTVVDTPAGRLAVGQVMGRVFMDPLDDPFAAADRILEALPGIPLVLDVHAEATSEKKVLGYHLRGRASAVIGTHTHVQTADESVFDGTAYITDVGMSGVQESSIGMQFEEVHARFTTRRPHRFRPANGRAVLCAVAFDVEGGRARSIERIRWAEQDPGRP